MRPDPAHQLGPCDGSANAANWIKRICFSADNGAISSSFAEPIAVRAASGLADRKYTQ